MYQKNLNAKATITTGMMFRARQKTITPKKVALIERCYRDYVISRHCAQEMSLEKKKSNPRSRISLVCICARMNIIVTLYTARHE